MPALTISSDADQEVQEPEWRSRSTIGEIAVVDQEVQQINKATVVTEFSTLLCIA